MEADAAANAPTPTLAVTVPVNIPPRIAAILPPPPPIAPPLSLSQRFAQLREQQGEPQPEQVSSHLQTVPTNEVQTAESDENVPTTEVQIKIETEAETIEQGTDIEREEAAEMPSAPATSPLALEPEYRANAFTERELAELDAAEEEVAWPTTKPD